MEIKVNGEAKLLESESTLAELLKHLNIGGKNLAIEYNGEFLNDEMDFNSIIIKSGDQLEVVRFVGGG